MAIHWQNILVLLGLAVCDAVISCKNEAGEPVNWFIFYKLPKYKIGEEGSGVDYMYLDTSVDTQQLSKFMVNTTQGAVANTLDQLYSKAVYQSNGSVYALYNDAPPDLKYIQGYGHTKGVLLFDTSQGFWLSHSIPHFPSFPEKGYLYPSSGKANGQTALCVSIRYEHFLRIEMPELTHLCAGKRPVLPSDKNMELLFSLQGEVFFSLANLSVLWMCRHLCRLGSSGPQHKPDSGVLAETIPGTALQLLHSQSRHEHQ